VRVTSFGFVAYKIFPWNHLDKQNYAGHVISYVFIINKLWCLPGRNSVTLKIDEESDSGTVVPWLSLKLTDTLFVFPSN